jgi:glycosyltransferase involved in cell wall biosynthesis
MRVILDARKLGDGGIGSYIESLVDGMTELIAEQHLPLGLTLLVTKKWQTKLQDSTHRWYGKVQIVCEKSSRYSISEYFLLPLRQRELINQHDIYHSPHYTLPAFLKIPSIVTIHDIIHVSHPDSFFHRPVGKALIQSALNRASRVITVSRASAKAIADEFGHLKHPVAVVENAVSQPLKSFSRAVSISLGQEGAGYMLFVGSDRPHKGFDMLLEAWRKFVSERKQRGLKPFVLVAVGAGFSQETRDKVASLGLEPYVHFFGGASGDELAALYRSARGLLMPSKVEGFGLPALEAMWFGVPVVATPLESLKEVCDDCAWYSSEQTPKAFCDALLSMTGDSEKARWITRKAIERASSFEPKLLAKKTYAVYCDALGLELPKNEGDSRVKSVAVAGGYH